MSHDKIVSLNCEIVDFLHTPQSCSRFQAIRCKRPINCNVSTWRSCGEKASAAAVDSREQRERQHTSFSVRAKMTTRDRPGRRKRHGVQQVKVSLHHITLNAIPFEERIDLSRFHFTFSRPIARTTSLQALSITLTASTSGPYLRVTDERMSYLATLCLETPPRVSPSLFCAKDLTSQLSDLRCQLVPPIHPRAQVIRLKSAGDSLSVAQKGKQ